MYFPHMPNLSGQDCVSSCQVALHVLLLPFSGLRSDPSVLYSRQCVKTEVGIMAGRKVERKGDYDSASPSCLRTRTEGGSMKLTRWRPKYRQELGPDHTAGECDDPRGQRQWNVGLLSCNIVWKPTFLLRTWVRYLQLATLMYLL
jgi:hypothetical protein